MLFRSPLVFAVLFKELAMKSLRPSTHPVGGPTEGPPGLPGTQHWYAAVCLDWRHRQLWAHKMLVFQDEIKTLIRYRSESPRLLPKPFLCPACCGMALEPVHPRLWIGTGTPNIQASYVGTQ